MKLEAVQDTVYDFEQGVKARLKELALPDLIKYYRAAHTLHKVFKRIKSSIKETVNARLAERGTESFESTWGTALITNPSPVVDEDAWQQALTEDEHLRHLESTYQGVKSRWENAREKFKKEREGWVVIRG